MVRSPVSVEVVAQLLVEIFDTDAAGNNRLAEPFFAHPLFGFGDDSLAQVMPAVFRQHDDAPDFGGFAIDTEPAACCHRVNIIEGKDVMAIRTVLRIDFGVERNLMLAHHRLDAHIVGTSAFAFFCYADDLHERNRLFFFGNAHELHGGFPRLAVFETVALAAAVTGVGKFFHEGFPTFKLAVLDESIQIDSVSGPAG